MQINCPKKQKQGRSEQELKKNKHRHALCAAILMLVCSSANATCELIPLKQQNFGGLELIRACSIIPFLALQPGGPDICDGLPVLPPQEPVVNLVANNMLYFNWEIPAKNVPAFEQALQLPDRGFQLSPIEIIRNEKPRYYLSLNFYSVVIAGVVNYRSEWSVYVRREGDSKPRYMVIEVQSSEAGADPTYPGFIKPASEVIYEIDKEDVNLSNEGFVASLSLPKTGAGRKVHVGKPWVEANDALYWINGLADTALYNGGLTDASLISVNPNKVELSNSSPWAAFVKGKPSNVLLFQRPLELAFTPYFNLNDPSLGLDPAYTGALQVFENFTFGAYSYGHAFLVLMGLEESLLPFNVLNDNVPSIFINFVVPPQNVAAFEAALELPTGFKLARSKMTADQPMQHLLTLNIYQTLDVLTGAPVFRAEWSTYVHDLNDSTSDRSFLMVIDVDSSGASLNPVDLFTPPAPIFNFDLQGGRLSADIWRVEDNAVAPKFSVAFDMPAAKAPSVSLEDKWVLENDRVYWRNGVYDELLYNGLLLDADVADVDPRSVTVFDNTPWSQYVNAAPNQVLVFRNPLEFVLRPWKNVEERCAANP
jgi:hypothetical protein